MSRTKFTYKFIKEQRKLLSDRQVTVAHYSGKNIEDAKKFSDDCLEFNKGETLWFLAGVDKTDPEGIGSFIALTGNAPTSKENAERLYEMWNNYPAALDEIERLRKALELIESMSEDMRDSSPCCMWPHDIAYEALEGGRDD
jgi:hypothetical protein